MSEILIVLLGLCDTNGAKRLIVLSLKFFVLICGQNEFEWRNVDLPFDILDDLVGR